MATNDSHREMFQSLPWPFPQNRFPAQLGAVVMRTVLEEQWPALQVVHFPDRGRRLAAGASSSARRFVLRAGPHRLLNLDEGQAKAAVASLSSVS